MKTVRTLADLKRALEPFRPDASIGFVPTMGAFHDGHVALFQAARRDCDVVVVSVFVNPAQFGDPTDLATYPRDEAHDSQIATAARVDVFFVPTVDEMYPVGYASWVDVEGPADGLENAARPIHFRGVATICLKLFAIVRPRLAFFGQKDAQQVAVIKQMVRDFNLDLDIRVVPTVRDADGLALSSRNARLSADDRARALAIPRALAAGVAAYQRGGDPAAAAHELLGGVEVDYVAVADFDRHPTLLIAVRVGTTRLIDNVRLQLAPNVDDAYHPERQ
jgi:pantoate--beta-alanine ligase